MGSRWSTVVTAHLTGLTRLNMNPIPLQYGLYYHIYSRGNNRENIFIEERNYRYFLQLYLKYIEPVPCFNGPSAVSLSQRTRISRG